MDRNNGGGCGLIEERGVGRREGECIVLALGKLLFLFWG